ncbi:unnamed protein product [Tuber melanosporum]|uniref:(Perigord truffle) hypothetical protein n=1 Tax=Tuber melanosporum (strain Mel28) TaxID=656061 RepID=D5GHW6_TUBMM|nr:uncharacterized protein GSTUM_00008151001 [Tuber melanosporum]CAZ84109.1 unnamed protein product [Tuber melanosporum]
MIADWTKDQWIDRKAEFVDKTPVEYILTVPAVWSDRSKSDTLKCAVDAGFCSAGEVSLITEPEAAAVYTFTTLPEYSIKKGTIFLTCDAGGGTVDLITYRVLDTKPVLKVEEATLGTGGLCGSVYLNRRFEDFVAKKIGKYLDALPRVAYLEGMTEIHRAFNEEVKTDFGHGLEDEKEYTIEVPAGIPDSEESGVRDGCLVIRQKDLEEVFDPVIDRIVMLIAEQIEAVSELPGENKVSAILLVGGFGSSEYLRRKIEGNPLWEGTDVIQPVNAWSAVVRGALLRGLQGDIVSTRKIRNFYGIEYRQTWEPEIHEVGDFANEAAQHKEWSDVEQRYFCAQRMNWYVKRGDEFSSSMVVNFPFYRAITDTAQLRFTEELITYTSSGDAPDFINSQCSVLAGIEVDLTSFPLGTWEMVQSSAGSYYKVDYALEMSFEAAISFKVVCKGAVVGEIVADYDKK